MPKKRKRQQRDLKPRLHIFCEGEKTEPNYLNGYIERCFPGTRLTVVEKTDKNTPVQLVEEAVSAKRNRDSLGTDQFWVVYDRESVVKYSPELHDEAMDKASANGIKIAFSNVCFEVWILLHFQETVPAYDCCADLLHRSRLKKHIPGYDKGDKREFSEQEVSAARKNAKHLNKQTIAAADRSWNKEHQWNPYTDVYKLLDAMDKHQKKYG
jgi:hypothetical protein